MPIIEWECTECGYIYEGSQPPSECPDCGAVRSWLKVEYEDLPEEPEEDE